MLLLDLKGRAALVAGSTQGIGLAAAKELADLGATCTLIARNEESLRAAVNELSTAHGQQHQYLIADFSEPEHLKTVIQSFIENQTIDILVNNSGGPAAGPASTARTEDFLAAFNQHLICNHILTTAVLPGMRKKGYGRIINVISTSVKIPLKNLGVSNTIRGAVASWAKTIANENAQYGITVNNVLPGATATGRLDAIINNKVQKMGIEKAEAEQEMISEIPAGRFGKPEEIAALIAFLATPAAAYICGTSTQVDGGRTGTI